MLEDEFWFQGSEDSTSSVVETTIAQTITSAVKVDFPDEMTGLAARFVVQ